MARKVMDPSRGSSSRPAITVSGKNGRDVVWNALALKEFGWKVGTTVLIEADDDFLHTLYVRRSDDVRAKRLCKRNNKNAVNDTAYVACAGIFDSMPTPDGEKRMVIEEGHILAYEFDGEEVTLHFDPDKTSYMT